MASLLRAAAELLLGNLTAALRDVREAVTAGEQSSQPLFAAHSLALESLVEAHAGRAGEAEQAARRARKLASRSRWVDVVVASALGHLELARNEATATIAHLAPATDLVRSEGIRSPARPASSRTTLKR